MIESFATQTNQEEINKLQLLLAFLLRYIIFQNIVDNYKRFLDILGIFRHFDNFVTFWEFCDILKNFEDFASFLDILRIFRHFGIFQTFLFRFLNVLHDYKPLWQFFGGIFSTFWLFLDIFWIFRPLGDFSFLDALNIFGDFHNFQVGNALYYSQTITTLLFYDFQTLVHHETNNY